MTKPIELQGLRRDTLGVLWALRADGWWESANDGDVRMLAELDNGPYGPTREVVVGDAGLSETAERARVAFKISAQLAPRPDSDDAAVSDWLRHYAALALAAHGIFREAEAVLRRPVVKASRPDLGYLVTIATSATAAAVALAAHPEARAKTLWAVTPGAGNLNGEDVDWLAENLDGLGVNPADLYRWFDAADFKSPVAAVREASR